MPWSKKDAAKHTKSATSPTAKAKWSRVANAVLKSSGNEGKAIRIANAMVKKGKK